VRVDEQRLLYHFLLLQLCFFIPKVSGIES
jgi:hypothetical protein